MTKRRKATIPPAGSIMVKPPDYQPSAKELMEKRNMPGLSDKQIRDTFFRPFSVAVKRG